MTTNADSKNRPAALRSAGVAAKQQALAVLEQMYGYFSFDPMPLEKADSRLAA
ncbi:hypothetical protein SAMN04488021_12237 [Paracoccus aminovorans]|uniref:Uncharacterized protein n=1 Tax=Paracoccus aminovorans TaxID=34004 RepID=A0A1I3BJ72_9RHOB|nr:hypothetical protein [Paracoccus aminovorans]CQR87079.1 hypothetical protein JCM7685_2534 [Paracoccus aminovorans]SFH62313.1 hypothetical protein SAMN04488021_12237 [Paracoccus aminovorans]